MKQLALGPHLKFDALELATEVSAFIGMRGSGKSNVMAVAAEGMLARGVQVIVLDYVGIWFSLRLQPDGKTASDWPIPVLGGRHGDIGLQSTGGKLVAESLGRSGSSAVLDLSGFSKADRCRFAADFAERLFEVKREHPGPCWLALEEAQRFVPQKIMAGMEYLARMLGAFEEIAEVGRNFGLGLGLNTQRPQKLAKDVLNLADNVFAFRLNGVLERKAIAEWVQEKGAAGREDVSGELPGLPRGTALVWSPVREIYAKHALLKKTTYDAGATPLHARAAVKVEALDLGEIQSSMAKLVEESKANDPKALKAEVARLRKEIALAGQTPVKEVEKAVTKIVEVPVVFEDERQEIADLVSDLHNAIANFSDKVIAQVARLPKPGERPPGFLQPIRRAERFPTPPSPRHPVVGRNVPTGNPGATIGKGERVILVAIAQHHPNGVTREQLTVLTGYKRSTRDTYLQRLAFAGYIHDTGIAIHATPDGKALLGDDYQPLPTGNALRMHHLSTLPSGESRVLEVVVSAYPNGIDRDAISDATGFKRSTRDTYLQRLAARKLVVGDRGPVHASEMLFS